MAPHRPRKLAITVKPATEEMQDVSLHCRAFGHLWRLYEPPMSEKKKMIAQGYITYDRDCANGCGCRWTLTYSVPGFTLLESKRRYPKDGYTMPPGAGRLARTDALAARFARQHPALLQ